MHITRTNRGKSHPSGHRHSHRSVAIGCRAVADLAVVVISPTVGLTRTVEGTGV